jgi:hypothetical protein
VGNQKAVRKLPYSDGTNRIDQSSNIGIPTRYYNYFISILAITWYDLGRGIHSLSSGLAYSSHSTGENMVHRTGKTRTIAYSRQPAHRCCCLPYESNATFDIRVKLSCTSSLRHQVGNSPHYSLSKPFAKLVSSHFRTSHRLAPNLAGPIPRAT